MAKKRIIRIRAQLEAQGAKKAINKKQLQHRNALANVDNRRTVDTRAADDLLALAQATVERDRPRVERAQRREAERQARLAARQQTEAAPATLPPVNPATQALSTLNVALQRLGRAVRPPARRNDNLAGDYRITATEDRGEGTVRVSGMRADGTTVSFAMDESAYRDLVDEGQLDTEKFITIADEDAQDW